MSVLTCGVTQAYNTVCRGNSWRSTGPALQQNSCCAYRAMTVTQTHPSSAPAWQNASFKTTRSTPTSRSVTWQAFEKLAAVPLHECQKELGHRYVRWELQATLQMAPMFSATWSASQTASQSAASEASQYAAAPGGTLVSRTQVTVTQSEPLSDDDPTDLEVWVSGRCCQRPDSLCPWVQIGPGMVRATQPGTMSQVSIRQWRTDAGTCPVGIHHSGSLAVDGRHICVCAKLPELLIHLWHRTANGQPVHCSRFTGAHVIHIIDYQQCTFCRFVLSPTSLTNWSSYCAP